MQLDLGVLVAQGTFQHPDHPSGHVGHVDRSLELLGQGLVDQGDRGDPPDRVLQGGHRLRVVPSRRAWSRSRDATVWRLFLTRWWTSRMVASRREMTRSRRRSSVASRTSTRAPRRRCPQQRDHPDVGHRPGGLDLGLDRAPAGHGLGHQDGGPVGEGLAERQGVGAHAPEGRGGVGAGELDPAAGVEHDQAVADPWRGGRVDGLHEREGPVATISSSASAAPR